MPYYNSQNEGAPRDARYGGAFMRGSQGAPYKYGWQATLSGLRNILGGMFAARKIVNDEEQRNQQMPAIESPFIVNPSAQFNFGRPAPSAPASRKEFNFGSSRASNTPSDSANTPSDSADSEPIFVNDPADTFFAMENVGKKYKNREEMESERRVNKSDILRSGRVAGRDEATLAVPPSYVREGDGVPASASSDYYVDTSDFGREIAENANLTNDDRRADLDKALNRMEKGYKNPQSAERERKAKRRQIFDLGSLDETQAQKYYDPRFMFPSSPEDVVMTEPMPNDYSAIYSSPEPGVSSAGKSSRREYKSLNSRPYGPVTREEMLLLQELLRRSPEAAQKISGGGGLRIPGLNSVNGRVRRPR